jgi:hypothetical protein
MRNVLDKSYRQHHNTYFMLNNVSVEPEVAYWLRHCATSRRVSGSIPSGVAGDFFRSSDGTMYPGVDSAPKNECQDV